MKKQKIKNLKNPVPAVSISKPISYLPYVGALVAFALYANTLNFGFALDDVAVITQNKYVQNGLAGIPDIVAGFYWEGYWEANAGLYRPLSLVLFAIEYQFFNGNPFIHHFMNVLLFSLAIFLLFKWMKLLLPTVNDFIPFAVCLFFAAHPIHTEVVANIKSRDEILSLLFFLFTAITLLKGELSVKSKIIAAIFFFLALISKESAILFLPILFIQDLMFTESNARKSIGKLMFFAPVVGFWLIIHQLVIRTAKLQPIVYTYFDNSILACEGFLNQMATSLTIFGDYILKSVCPYKMSHDYSFGEIPCYSFADLWPWLTFAAIGLMLYLAYKIRLKNKLLSFGILFFFISIFLTSNIFFKIGATMADRFLFIPSLGITMAIISLFAFSKWSNQLKYALLVLPFLAYSFKTVDRNKAWKSDATLYTTDVQIAKNSCRNNYNYGSLLLNTPNQSEENLKIANAFLDKAVQIDSNYYDAWVNSGVSYYKTEQYPEALYRFLKANKISQHSGSLFHNIGDAYFMNKQYENAIQFHQMAIAKGVTYQNTYNFIGTAYFNLNQIDNAEAAYREGVKQNPNFAEMWLNLGNALARKGNFSQSLECLQKAYDLDKNRIDALYFMAIIYKEMGDLSTSNAVYNQYRQLGGTKN